ncbi:hypothetical protein A2W14_03850 [Candidatus Gottesmanbacteria bacterium RBG_16_37_8]|uniref:Uncharacterized protein n=1 Tax=Candidatus Gottesmanbacteria bacterium RBG_16_37_8 TaxID=1798371 RepID=A0A1F5YTT7_9BACT|nr:MAG: hypothetical protein A2W14_03850 [Candidatus Gottesmanbacteria bacterium RBG_16_37_8]
MKSCSKCNKKYRFPLTEWDLCPDCVEKYPYFLSFIEEGLVGVTDKIFGRVEVYDYKEPVILFTSGSLRFAAWAGWYSAIGEKELVEQWKHRAYTEWIKELGAGRRYAFILIIICSLTYYSLIVK